MNGNTKRVLCVIAGLALLVQWALPVLMPLSDGLSVLVGANVNWIIVLTLFIAVVALGLVVAPTLNRKTVALICVGVIVDQGIGELAYRSHSPLFLDTIGSVLVSALLGPTVGVFVASLSCLAWVGIAPTGIPFSVATICTAWIAGLVARADGFDNWITAGVSGIVAGVTAGILASPLSYVLKSTDVDPDNFDLYRSLEAVNFYFEGDVPFALFLADPLDKFIVFSLCYFLIPVVMRTFGFHAPHGKFRGIE